eukprot:m.191978 g.191978  ORF g.191978 m.191978 type:complete len:820 (-) comp18530_c0_seq1:14-2473(-)
MSFIGKLVDVITSPFRSPDTTAAEPDDEDFLLADTYTPPPRVRQPQLHRFAPREFGRSSDTRKRARTESAPSPGYARPASASSSGDTPTLVAPVHGVRDDEDKNEENEHTDGRQQSKRARKPSPPVLNPVPRRNGRRGGQGGWNRPKPHGHLIAKFDSRASVTPRRKSRRGPFAQEQENIQQLPQDEQLQAYQDLVRRHANPPGPGGDTYTPATPVVPVKGSFLYDFTSRPVVPVAHPSFGAAMAKQLGKQLKPAVTQPPPTGPTSSSVYEGGPSGRRHAHHPSGAVTDAFSMSPIVSSPSLHASSTPAPPPLHGGRQHDNDLFGSFVGSSPGFGMGMPGGSAVGLLASTPARGGVGVGSRATRSAVASTTTTAATPRGVDVLGEDDLVDDDGLHYPVSSVSTQPFKSTALSSLVSHYTEYFDGTEGKAAKQADKGENTNASGKTHRAPPPAAAAAADTQRASKAASDTTPTSSNSRPAAAADGDGDATIFGSPAWVRRKREEIAEGRRQLEQGILELKIQDNDMRREREEKERKDEERMKELEKSFRDEEAARKTRVQEEVLEVLEVSDEGAATKDAHDDEDVDVDYTPLSEQQLARVQDAWDANLDPSELLCKIKTIELTRGDFSTVADTEWLNDNVMNSYMTLLQQRNAKDASFPNFWSFTTFFYPQLKSKGYNSVRRWTKEAKCPGGLKAYDIIVVPLHLGVHWCCGFIDFRHKTIEMYDSLGSSEQSFYRNIREYLDKEWQDKHGHPFDFDGWEDVRSNQCPQQRNGFDCGMFALKFADFRSRDKHTPFSFTQNHIEYFRQRATIELLQGEWGV